MMRCIAIDDEPLALKQMVSYIDKCGFLQLVTACDNAIVAFEMLKTENVDLIFVDINMPGLNGIDFVKKLQSRVLVIFTTAYSQYAVESYKVDAVDYLLKPIDYDSFLRAASKANEWFTLMQQTPAHEFKANNNFLFLKSEYKIIRINIADIKYIEGMREYVRIHFDNRKPVMSLLSMKSIEQQLANKQFMRVHRSYIVNLNKVTIIERNRIIFDPDVYIPISDQYKESFQKYIDSNFL